MREERGAAVRSILPIWRKALSDDSWTPDRIYLEWDLEASGRLMGR